MPEIENAAAGIEVFISHSSADAEIAGALVELIRATLNLAPAKIRCSSVDGYRLPGGAQTDQQLKMELRTAKAFIGLLTEGSLASTYVLFELGARWGAELHLTPLIAGSMEKKDLKGPLSGLNAHSCNNPAELHQLLEELGSILSSRLNSAASYIRYLERLLALSQAQQSVAKHPITVKPLLQKSPATPGSSLEFTVRFVSVREDHIHTWRRGSGAASYRAAVLTVMNEPSSNAKSLKSLRALISFENEHKELWRIHQGCWLEHETDEVSFNIGHSRELILLLLSDKETVRAIEYVGYVQPRRIFYLVGDEFNIKIRFMEQGVFLLDRQYLFKRSSLAFEEI